VQQLDQRLVVTFDRCAGCRDGLRDGRQRRSAGYVPGHPQRSELLGEGTQIGDDQHLGLPHRSRVSGQRSRQRRAVLCGSGDVGVLGAEQAIGRSAEPLRQAAFAHREHVLRVPVGVAGRRLHAGCGVAVSIACGGQRILVDLRPVLT